MRWLLVLTVLLAGCALKRPAPVLLVCPSWMQVYTAKPLPYWRAVVAIDSVGSELARWPLGPHVGMRVCVEAWWRVFERIPQE